MQRTVFLRQMVSAALVAWSAGALPGFAQPASAEPVRVGYWTSGVSLGFGAVLEAQNFLQQRGLDVKFVRFADVNARNRALAANAIDFAFAAPAAAVFSAAADGVPLKVVLATQPADVEFVAPQDSPIRSLADLRGTLADLLKAIFHHFPKLTAMERAMLVAVGVDYQPRDYVLKDGEEVSLFPPVQGG